MVSGNDENIWRSSLFVFIVRSAEHGYIFVVRRKSFRMEVKAKFLGCLGLVGVLFVSAAYAGNEKKISVEPETLKEIGTVVFGSDGAYPPFNFLDDAGNLTGFEVDMIHEIAARTGISIEIKTLPWDGIFGQMDSKRIDTVVCCIFPSDERQKKYDFSREYIYDENRIIVRKGDGAKYKTFEDLKGLRIGCAAGGNTILRLEELQKKVPFEIVAYSEEGHPYDLAMGRLDAIYKSPVSAFIQAKQGGFELEVAACPSIEEGSCAFPWRKDEPRSEKIRKIFSEATQQLIDDGTMKELSMKWLGLDETAYKPLKVFE